MEISASVVKQLREKTGVGMMECKTALLESKGDMAEAEKRAGATQNIADRIRAREARREKLRAQAHAGRPAGRTRAGSEDNAAND